jgi:oxygen-independent coproporphyrinogen-3 oxidase
VNPAGVYIHVPFCRRKCPYCDFHSTTEIGRMPEYLAALGREIALAEPLEAACDTIYFGGGTPSLLEPDDVGRIIGALQGRLRFEAAVEITLEANPGTLAPGRLKGYLEAGVNRLNIGVQSFRLENLRFLGRIHTAADAAQCLEQARAAGFENLGLDLIYGLPGQGREDWRRDLDAALEHRPEHIACYLLTVEPGTPLAAGLAEGRFRAASEARQAELFLFTSEYLEAGGYRHYEISNFARRDPSAGGGERISRHNAKYWSRAPYLGFGPAAHSFVPPRRWWNLKETARYAARLRAGALPREGGEILDSGQAMLEALMLGLRTAAGIDPAEFGRRFGIDFEEVFGRAAAGLAAQGLLVPSGGRIAPTRRGMLFHDTLCAALAAQAP